LKQYVSAVIALLLWYSLGWHAAAAELFAELLVGLLLFRGGGGKRIRATARELLLRPLQRIPAVISQS
jgi:hypothetical protein